MGDIVFSVVICLCGVVFIGMGVYALKLKTPMFFFSGVKVKSEEIKDIKGYNKGNAIMWISYGGIFVVAGILQFFIESYIPVIILVVACFPGFIVLIFVYLRIKAKYGVK